MEERLQFDITLFGPEDGDDQWEARHAGLAGYGESGGEATTALTNQLDDIIEDAEYNRVHAPRVYGHDPDRQVSQMQRSDDPEVQKGNRRQEPDPLHSSD